MNWKIYYSNGSTFSDDDGDVMSAPVMGVQVIVQTDANHGWITQSHDNFYVWDNRGIETRWWGCDVFGLTTYFCKPGWKRVLLGEQISDGEFTEIYRRAQNDPDFPEKTAFSSDERKPA